MRTIPGLDSGPKLIFARIKGLASVGNFRNCHPTAPQHSIRMARRFSSQGCSHRCAARFSSKFRFSGYQSYSHRFRKPGRVAHSLLTGKRTLGPSRRLGFTHHYSLHTRFREVVLSRFLSSPKTTLPFRLLFALEVGA